MTNEDIRLVRRSFLDALVDRIGFAEAFYRRLFSIAPHTRQMFSNDITAQRIKLMDTLVAVMDMLDKPDKLAAAVGALGARHTVYGVTPADYAPVGEALIWTFETRLGSRYTCEMREAWGKAYDALARMMIEAKAV